MSFDIWFDNQALVVVFETAMCEAVMVAFPTHNLVRVARLDYKLPDLPLLFL